jgi:hypothetical protein
MTAAARWVDYAEKLMSTVGEEAHVETAEERPIAVGNSVDGRLGFGDAVTASGGISDRFVFALGTKTAIAIELNSEPCRPRLLLTDASGKSIEEDAPIVRVRPASIKKTLAGGEYHIWAGCINGYPGRYTMSLLQQ